MFIYQILAWAHIVLAILIAGMALYWVIMDHALRARHGPLEAERLMAAARGLRWPPIAIPDALRPTLPLLGLLLGIAQVTIGLLLVSLGGVPSGFSWWLKVGLVAGLLVHQVLLLSRSKTSLYRAQFAIALLVVALSAWLPR
ncbi:MAG: hypothetical protein ACO3IN_11675 [Steroidobacteraceae bacterium]